MIPSIGFVFLIITEWWYSDDKENWDKAGRKQNELSQNPLGKDGEGEKWDGVRGLFYKTLDL